MILKPISVPPLESTLNNLTWPEPRLLNDGVPMPVPSSSSYRISYLACWVWVIAGQQCASSFEITPKMSDAEIQDRAQKARGELVEYVRRLLSNRTDGSLGVVPESGDIPLPARA